MTDNVEISQKTRELCQALVTQPEFQSIRQRIETFQNDENTKTQYFELNSKREELEEKQQKGQTLGDAEVADFEKRRDDFLQNPVAVDFLDAQQEIQQMRQDITQYITKTFELGRVPAPEDLSSCGHGCNCH
jgi:cell fate (sporulation/competence/biofilm development) regulator YlbF (YheA/YmcA/DUF963 family)